MKNLYLLCLLISACTFANAANDTLTYVFTMNDGSQLKGKIVALKEGEYVKLIKEDNTEQTIAWDVFKNYKSTTAIAGEEKEKAQKKTDKQAQKDAKAYEKLKAKHKDWNRCTLIIGKDSAFVRIKYKDEYSMSGGFSSKKITIAYPDENEKRYFPEEYSAFIVDRDTDIVKYVSVHEENAAFCGLYRVIVDGQCQLLFDEQVRSSAGAMGAGGMMMGGGMYIVDKYYLHYKQALTRVRTDNGLFAVSSAFRKKCRETLSDCPSLVEKIENKTYHSSDLRDIVQEFNQCVGDNSQQKKY